ncbi:alcohol dehydrogenase catalytic domain-containing protein [Streptomyces sp. NPDC055025]
MMSTTTYRAVRATPGSTFELVQLPLPQPGQGQVRLTVEACGVCHSDVFAVENLFGLHAQGASTVPGHEVIGRIEAVGDGVDGWNVGQRVGLGFLGGHCGICAMCRRGRFVHCTDQPVVGDSHDGGYAEKMVARASGLVRLPEDIDAATAAPLMCAGLTMFNALRNTHLRPGDLVAIQGIGGLGHLGIQYARKMNLQVAAIARGDDKRALAVQLGAHHYIDSTSVDPGEALQKLGGARVIVATATSGASMSALPGGLAVEGRLIIVGATNDPVEVDTATLILGGRSVHGALTGTAADNEENLAFSVAHDVRPVIETMPLELAADAYARMLAGDARFRVVITMN